MAIDSTPMPSKPERGSVSAIENEFPTYRAISPQAIISVVFGVLSLLCFTDLFFLTFAAAAIVFGVLADRKIQRLPEILTGRGMAQAGIALGLIFGLAAVTIVGANDFILRSQAKRFGRTYAEVLKRGKFDDAYWYRQSPDFRKDKSPREVVKAARQGDSRMFEMENRELRLLTERIASSPKEDLHFVRVEKYGHEGLGAYASALFEVHGPGIKDSPEEAYALAILRGVPKGRKYEWIVDTVKFPYTPDSYVHQEKPVDDGHGHGGGGHGH